MKKLICSILIVLILFNFIGSINTPYVVEARDAVNYNDSKKDDDPNNINKSSPGEGVVDTKGVMETADNGKAAVGEGGTSVLSIVWNALDGGAIAGTLAAVLNSYPAIIRLCMHIACEEEFTIEKTVFNEIGLFDVDYFNFDSTYRVGTDSDSITVKVNESTKLLKENVAQYYIIMRLIALTISLLILIYTGIRMALSTVSSEKAKYKKILIYWFESILLLFFMQYIISAIYEIGKIITNILYYLKETEALKGTSFETDIMDKIVSAMPLYSGWKYVIYSVLFWFLVFIQTKYFFSYYKRVVTVGYLIFIAPIITITYAIDKIDDGKSQAFTVWFLELLTNILIQPMHALIYLIFMYSAGEIAKHSLFVAGFFLLSLSKVEKLFLYLFNLKNVVSLRPIDEERKK